MKKYTITKAKFLDWFYKTGDDDSQSELITDLGQAVIDHLNKTNSFNITTQEIFNNYCEHSAIQLKYLEEYPRAFLNEKGVHELVDLKDQNYKVVLI